MKLTSFHNGFIVDIDRNRIDSISPHVDGGSAIKVNGITYHVTEEVEKILEQNDR